MPLLQGHCEYLKVVGVFKDWAKVHFVHSLEKSSFMSLLGDDSFKYI